MPTRNGPLFWQYALKSIKYTLIAVGLVPLFFVLMYPNFEDKIVIERTIDMVTPKDPLHGVSLETILTELVEYYGFEELGNKININCFKVDPSIKSSLTFLRRTPWARAKVEKLYKFYRIKKVPKSKKIEK